MQNPRHCGLNQDRDRLGLEIALHEAGLNNTVVPGLWVDTDQTVAIAYAEAGAFVGWLDVTWIEGRPEWHLRSVVHLPMSGAERALATALSRVRAKRQAALRRCNYCGREYVPGHMHANDVCQGCAERHLGVVH